MPTEARTARPDELLADAAWLRRLASALVGGSHDPDDLAQDVWVAALRRPPRVEAPGPSSERPLRSWLAEVLRNAVRMQARGGRRRLARDGAFAAATPDEVPSPERLLERLHTQRLLAGLVAGLAEPYRSTLLLHYYEGLSSAEIARLQRVPAGTVRWRLKAGLDQLRSNLDRESPGGRKIWFVALLPLADRAALGPASLWQHALKGALIMGQTSKVAAVATLLVASGGLFFATRRAPPADEIVAASGPAPAHEAPSTPTDARRARDALRDEILAALRRREAELAPPAAPRVPSAAVAPVVAAAIAAPAAAAVDAPEPANSAPTPLAVGHYEPSYIQEVFREAMFPLLSQCYENALAQRPKLAGTFVLSFAIVADPEVGGVVDEAEFDPESDLKDAEMEACARESLLTLTFDKPPRGGGRVTVKYPVAFAPGDDGDDGEGDRSAPAR